MVLTASCLLPSPWNTRQAAEFGCLQVAAATACLQARGLLPHLALQAESIACFLKKSGRNQIERVPYALNRSEPQLEILHVCLVGSPGAVQRLRAPKHR